MRVLCWHGLLAAVVLAPGLACAQVSVAPQDSGTDVRLRGISAVDGQVAWASGRRGTVLRTIDGGAHWDAVPVTGAEELDFRDVEGFDARTAVVLSIGPGAASRIYRTVDAGQTWEQVLQNPDARGFFDCMAFDGDEGWLLGDPVDGRFQVYASHDRGRTWALLQAGGPAALQEEAAFAASGTCIAVAGGRPVVASGGGAARLLAQTPGGSWMAVASGLTPRVPAAGVFSATPLGGGLLLVGGDFEHETQPGGAAQVQLVAHQPPRVAPLPSTPGYRSGAACSGGAAPVCVAVGPTGVDALVAGAWRPVSDTGYDAVDLVGDVGWASGADGRIARIRIGAD